MRELHGLDCVCIRRVDRAERTTRGEDKAIVYVFGILDIPWWYHAIAVILAIVIGWKWRWGGGLLAGYSFLLLAETVLIRKPFMGEHLKLQLFWSWKQWRVQREQILTNIVMFIPVGLLAGRLWKWKGLFVAAGMSFLIELLQLITTRGLCEFDDVIHNCIGAVIGIGLVMVGVRDLNLKQKKKE